MDVAIRCVGLSHVYVHPREAACSSVPFFAEAQSTAQHQERQKEEESPLNPKTPNPKTLNPKPFSLNNVTFDVPRGARVLLLGSNGAGKSTLISLIGGQMMIQKGELWVLGRRAFDDSSLAVDRCCLNSWWEGDHFHDVRLEEILSPSLRHSPCWGAPKGAPQQGVPPMGPLSGGGSNGVSPTSACSCGKRFLCTTWRVEKLLQLLQVRLDWRVGKVSLGERRRCQFIASLAERKVLYLLDEATGELDIVSREMLCRFLLAESQELGSCVFYSSHVFDGLDGWPTHVLYLQSGALRFFLPVAEIPGLGEAPTSALLFSLARRLLLAEEHNKLPQDTLLAIQCSGPQGPPDGRLCCSVLTPEIGTVDGRAEALSAAACPSYLRSL